MMTSIRAALLLVAVSVAVAAGLAPYLDAEYAFNLHGGIPMVQPPPSVPVKGSWFEDYFLVEPIDDATFAIGEPRYYQGNYSYLMLGTERAVLFDAGSGLRDIRPVVRSLTSLPVTVVPSHLHFDHVGALGQFDRTAVLDDPSLRARSRDGLVTVSRYDFLGFADRLPALRIRADEWWRSGSSIDLGHRQVTLLATPGHTPTSVSLYDPQRHQLFSGDFIYPGHLYAFLPGASRSAYLATTRELLATIAADARIYAAHMAEPPAPAAAPVLMISDLRALETTLVAIEQGQAVATGFYPRMFPVNETMIFATGWAWNNR